MKYLSVCSGIEAATVAWHPLGWKPLAFSEIEPFPRAVLAHHYPSVPCYGDFTKLRDETWIEDSDILVGGTPCQAFSIAGQRQSLSDDRGNLTLEFVRLADAIDNLRRIGNRNPAIIVWENVPGVLSVKDNAFGCFLAALVGNDTPIVHTGKRWTNAGMVIGPKRAAAWRILDAQYFGLAQRRRRVFVVASARDGFDPAAVLFEREGVRRDTPPCRKKGEAIAPTVTSGAPFSRTGNGTREGQALIPTISKCLNAGGMNRRDYETETFVPVAVNISNGAPKISEISGTLDAARESRGSNQQRIVLNQLSVRRLTPTECERLQGFPDGYTDIKLKGKETPASPRYKALGNSMAVPVMRWIGKRIKAANAPKPI